ncbi:MAG: hypothetical protein A2283_17255 [Lentisphaerae bacterium RIFOXYA12_FULL_48_11]|nr:MAG: hypothetical protein A2283_17255 [Lentisphaerae bacterium RIFOXYA12_FULL_48_11]
MRKTVTIFTITAFTCGLFSGIAGEETKPINITSTQQSSGILSVSLENELSATINRSFKWLASRQKEDGSWSDSNFPALTALPVWALTKSSYPDKEKILAKGIKFILSCVNENGGIYREVKGRKGGGLSNYNTAICMTALHATGDKAHLNIIRNARKFIAGSQHFGDDQYTGGFGYDRDTERKYTDLLNTFYAIEAMARTADVEDTRPKNEKKADIDWRETVKYLERMQNKPGAGDDNSGGFFYNPTDPKAGTSTNASGVIVFRSYGSITYAGMLALIYANISREDIRVQSAFDWAKRHWTLEENPGMGANGKYFFYNVLSRTLNAYGTNAIQLKDGSLLNWQSELAKKLISLQKTDSATGEGFWENAEARYWEGDPVLVTSYCLLALETALGK